MIITIEFKDVNYYGTMLVKTDKANGMVSGAVHSTGDTVICSTNHKNQNRMYPECSAIMGNAR